MVMHASCSSSASASSLFGIGSLASCDAEPVSGTSLKQHGHSGFAFTDSERKDELLWTGLLLHSRLISGLSWGVSCLRTDCRENQDGWAVQIYGSHHTPPQQPTITVQSGTIVTTTPGSPLLKSASAAHKIYSSEAGACEAEHSDLSGEFVPDKVTDHVTFEPPSSGHSCTNTTAMPSSAAIASNPASSAAGSSTAGRPPVTAPFSTSSFENAQPTNNPPLSQSRSPIFCSARSTATTFPVAQSRTHSQPLLGTGQSSSTPGMVFPDDAPPVVGNAFSFSWSHELTTSGCSSLQVSGVLKASKLGSVSLGPAAAWPQGVSAMVNRNPLIPLSINNRDTYIGTSTFVVLDGHGAGGRDAAAAVEKAFDAVFSRPTETDREGRTNPTAILTSLAMALRAGQSAVETLNEASHRDFGTTCVTVTLVDDMLISTSCGDSSALLFAFPPGQWSSSNSIATPVVIELSRRHHLEDIEELERINRQGRGRVIRGDGGVLRLIPGDIEYEEAKRRGLSINMSRSMGHSVFSRCGLSTEIDYFFLSLKQVPKLLAATRPTSSDDSSTNFAKCYRLPPLSFAEAERVIGHFSAKQATSNANTHQQNRSTSEGGAAVHSCSLHVQQDFLYRTEGACAAGDGKAGYTSAPTSARPDPRLSTCRDGLDAVSGTGGHARRRRSIFKSTSTSTAGGGSISGPSAPTISVGQALRERSSCSHHRHTRSGSGVSSRSLRGLVDARQNAGGLLKCFARRSASSPTAAVTPGISLFAVSPAPGMQRFSQCDTRRYSTNREPGGNGPEMVTNKVASEVSASIPAPTPPIGDMFVLLMSDGVTDVLSASCIIDVLKDFDLKSKSKRKAFDPAGFALTLTEVARERRLKACQRADNCTCLAVHLIPKALSRG